MANSLYLIKTELRDGNTVYSGHIAQTGKEALFMSHDLNHSPSNPVEKGRTVACGSSLYGMTQIADRESKKWTPLEKAFLRYSGYEYDRCDESFYRV